MVASPCTNFCQLKDNVCQGCFRTLDEISQWSTMTDVEKQQVLNRIF